MPATTISTLESLLEDKNSIFYSALIDPNYKQPEYTITVSDDTKGLPTETTVWTGDTVTGTSLYYPYKIYSKDDSNLELDSVKWQLTCARTEIERLQEQLKEKDAEIKILKSKCNKSAQQLSLF